jgi:hypothetical protein
MRNFMGVLSDGWQSLKTTVFGYFGSTPRAVNSTSPTPLNPVELHTCEQEPLQTQALYSQFMYDYECCCSNLKALNARKQPMDQAMLEQIKKLFQDYFKVVNTAKKEKNSEISAKTQSMFIQMTALFHKKNTQNQASRHQPSLKTAPSKSTIAQSSALNGEFKIRTANL